MESRIIYRLLLDECWMVGGIPRDREKSSAIIGYPISEAAWKEVSCFFISCPDHPNSLISVRLDEQKKQIDRKRECARVNGRYGGRPASDESKESSKKAEKEPAVDLSIPPPQMSQFDSELFGSIWGIYPNKIEKVRAQHSFLKIFPKADQVLVDRMIKTIIEFSKEWAKEDNKFVPTLWRWLDGNRWNDEVKKTIRKPSPF